MQRYCWPGHKTQLLSGLQKQQNRTQFCDTLLQTEGMSVPSHSCILAALSPYLCRKLSATPSPPSGQKRLLQLQPLKAQTLLQLVGLLYAGEVEVNGNVELNDLLAVAHLFGIRDLVKEDKNGNMAGELKKQMQLLVSPKENCTNAEGSERKEHRTMQDAQVQVEMADVHSPREKRNCVTIGTQTGENDGITSGSVSDSRENTQEIGQASGDDILGEEKEEDTDVRHPCANVGTKNLPNKKHMQQVLETTQISVKVKLRRRPNREAWEVVSPQDSVENLASPFHKQDSSKHTGLQTNPPPATQEPDILIVQPQSKTCCGSQASSCDGSTQNQSDGLCTAPRSQPQGTGEETDEQIEKLLEDIMIGFNILPNKDSKKSYQLQPDHFEVLSIGQAPVPLNIQGRSKIHAAASVPECVFYRDMGTQRGHHASDTAQNQPVTSLPVAQLDASLIQQQLQCSPQYYSTVRSMMHGEGLSCESMPLSKSQECLLPKESRTSAMASAAFSAGQKYPNTAGTGGQDSSRHTLENLPTLTTIEAQSIWPTVSLSYMDDLRIPPCLSPLDPYILATEHHPGRQNNKNQEQSSCQRRPWLTENPGCLQFPLSAFTQVEVKPASLPQVLNQDAKQDFSLQNSGTSSQSHTVQQQQINPRSQQDKGVKRVRRREKECLKCKQSDKSGDAVAPKRRKRIRTNHQDNLQDTASALPYGDTRNPVGTKCKIKISSCSVSLSSNNVLAKERKMATSNLNFPSGFRGNANPLSSTVETLTEETTTVNTHLTRLRTRGFMKKTLQHSANNLNPPVPVAYKATTLKIQDTFPKRKRGRPKKAKAQDLTPPKNDAAVVTEKSSSVESGDNPELHKNVLQVEVPQMADESEQPLKDEKKGKSCDLADAPNTTQNTDLVDVGGTDRTPGCDKEEEGDEEVDVLFLSPDRKPRVTGLTMEMIMDEEEEDVTDIDVTGDESE